MIGRKIEILKDDPVARAVEAEARRHDRLRDGRILVHGDRVARYAEDRCEEIAGLAADLPPAFVPGANAALIPLIGECLQMRPRTRGHRAERVAHEVRAGIDDRELGTPLEKGIHRRGEV
jgi:hypothetical protein